VSTARFNRAKGNEEKDLKKLVVKPVGFPYQFRQMHPVGAG
jgi:hypothetical protein